MKPLEQLDASAIDTVLFDIDDTLTTEGRLEAVAFSAMEALKRAGKRLVPVTGRPAGWCDHIARMWPVDAVVGENGAFYFHYSGGKLRKRYHDGDATRIANRERLRAIARRILDDVPGSALASDQAYRETDLAIDFCEDVPPLSLTTAERIASLMRDAGMTAKVSSIHVNGWFGVYDKLSMTRSLFSEVFGVPWIEGMPTVAFAGDSPNDAPMFGHFANSVGVANVRRFEAILQARPKFITSAPSGAGFAQLSAHLLKRA